MEISLKPNIYLSPLSQNVSKSEDFRLTKIEDIPCAYCGKEMKTKRNLDQIFSTDSYQTTEMLDNALMMGHLLPPFRQQVLNFLVQTKYTNGLVTDNQILKKARVLSRQYVREDILKRYNEIVDIIKKSGAKRLNMFLRFNEDKYREILVKKASYEELLDFIRSEKFLHIAYSTKNDDLAKINDVVFDIDEEKEPCTEEYLVKKISYKTEREFYTDLFEKAIASVDHVVAKTKGGTDTRDNFLAVCRGCNEKKSNSSLPLFMCIEPNVKPNIKKQIDFLKKAIPIFIKERKLDKDYLDYPERISENLAQITNGEIDLIA